MMASSSKDSAAAVWNELAAIKESLDDWRYAFAVKSGVLDARIRRLAGMADAMSTAADLPGQSPEPSAEESGRSDKET